jgi:hypothetical protein
MTRIDAADAGSPYRDRPLTGAAFGLPKKSFRLFQLRRHLAQNGLEKGSRQGMPGSSPRSILPREFAGTGLWAEGLRRYAPNRRTRLACDVRLQPFAVSEQRAQRQGNLPVPVAFGTGRKRSRIAQYVAPVLDEFSEAVKRMIQYQDAINTRHGGHLSQDRVQLRCHTSC